MITRLYLRTLLVWISLALLTISAAALDPNRQISQYAHTAWRIEDEGFVGAPTAFAQTKDGYLWIGTTGGLFRFDGVRFVPWSAVTRNKLSGDSISTLLGAGDGSLWIGTMRGLERWENGALTDYSPVPAMIGTILEDSKGAIWLARAKIRDGKGPLCEVTGNELSCHGAPDGIPFRYAKELLRDGSGNLWVSGPDGICRWKSGSSQTYSSMALQRLEGVLGIEAMALAADGSLWVGMRRSGKGLGLQQFANGVWRNYAVPGFDGTNMPINALFVDRDNSLWIGTPNLGIFRLNEGKSDHFTAADGLSSDAVEHFYQDREGDLWVATSKGIDRFHDAPVVTFSTREGLTTDEAEAVLGTRDGTVWIDNVGALDFFRNGELSRVKRSGIPKQLTTSLFEDHTGRLWVGVDAGLDVYGPDHHFQAISKPDGSALGMVTTMTEDVDHNVWVETAVGDLFRIQDLQVHEQFSRSQIPRASSLAADAKEGIWLALESGDLARYQHGHLQTISIRHGAKTSSVWNVLTDSDGSIWASTEAGLVHWNNGQIATLSSNNGLPCDAVFALVKDDQGTYWLDAPCGYIGIAASELAGWSAEPTRKVKFRLLDVFDGAQPAPSTFRPTASKSADGRLWFATDSIVQTIDPAHLAANQLAPPVHVEQLVADRKSYSPAADLRFPPHTRDLQIDYTALSLVAPQKVRFRYKLEGHDSDWQDPQNRRQAFYTDLPPGNYRFRVIASNNDGVWNEAGAEVGFEVLPAFYQTAWFRILSVFAAASILGLIYVLRLRHLAARMQARFEERLEERERIARDLHDTLLQGIYSASLHFNLADARLPEDSPAKTAVKRGSELLGQVSQEGRNALRSLRSSEATSDGLEHALSRLPKEFSLSAGLEFEVATEGQPRLLRPLIRDEAYLIAREAVLNAFRHARATKIEVEIDYAPGHLRILVRDNGCGMESGLLRVGREGHWGLTGMRERAEKIGAKLEVLSRTNAGTEVQLSVVGAVAFQDASTGQSWNWLTRLYPQRLRKNVKEPSEEQHK